MICYGRIHVEDVKQMVQLMSNTITSDLNQYIFMLFVEL